MMGVEEVVVEEEEVAVQIKVVEEALVEPEKVAVGVAAKAVPKTMAMPHQHFQQRVKMAGVWEKIPLGQMTKAAANLKRTVAW